MPDVSSSMTGHTSSRLSSTGQEHSNTVTQIVRQNVIGGAASVLDRIESGRWECVVRVHLFVGALDNGAQIRSRCSLGRSVEPERHSIAMKSC